MLSALFQGRLLSRLSSYTLRSRWAVSKTAKSTSAKSNLWLRSLEALHEFCGNGLSSKPLLEPYVLIYRKSSTCDLGLPRRACRAPEKLKQQHSHSRAMVGRQPMGNLDGPAHCAANEEPGPSRQCRTKRHSHLISVAGKRFRVKAGKPSIR